ncbi:MAG: VC0807 family protein [Actinoallomurus sp.]
MEATHRFEIPRLTHLARHALPRVIEGMIAPVVVFYAGLALLGLDGALVTAVAWVYGGIAVRLVRRRPVPGTLVLAALGVTARAAMAAVTGSAVVYFLQPTLGTMLVAMAFLGSVPLRRPLAAKVATDLVPLPAGFLKNQHVHRFFLRVSLLWSLVFTLNTGLSVWLLFRHSITAYLWIRTPAVALLGAAAVVISVWGFKRCVRGVAVISS